MNTQEKQKKISDMWLKLSKNEDAYFEFETSPNNWIISDGAPSLDNLSRMRVHIPVKQWEPEKGTWFINPLGKNTAPPRFTRNTHEQVAELTTMINTLSTLDAWACEKGYKKEFVENKENWHVAFDTFNKVYIKKWAGRYYSTSGIYMTEEGAKATAKALNSGELVL